MCIDLVRAGLLSLKDAALKLGCLRRHYKRDADGVKLEVGQTTLRGKVRVSCSRTLNRHGSMGKY